MDHSSMDNLAVVLAASRASSKQAVRAGVRGVSVCRALHVVQKYSQSLASTHFIPWPAPYSSVPAAPNPRDRGRRSPRAPPDAQSHLRLGQPTLKPHTFV